MHSIELIFSHQQEFLKKATHNSRSLQLIEIFSHWPTHIQHVFLEDDQLNNPGKDLYLAIPKSVTSLQLQRYPPVSG